MVWVKNHGVLAAMGESLLFDAARDCGELEFEALLLRIFRATLLPGLSRIPDCTRAAIIADDPLRAGVVQQIALRSARQARLGERDPLQVEAVFDEGLLYHVVGGPVVMRVQLLYLSERSNVEIQLGDRELCSPKFAALRRVALSPGESVELTVEAAERL